MSKRPHDDVDETEEDFDQQFYTGGIGRRRVEVATHLATMGLRSGVVLPMPLFFQAPYAGTVCPGTEALRFASLATVVHSFQVPSSPAAGAASSIDAAVQDDTASGQDTAPVPDRGTASRQDAAPVPNRDTASGQDELETQPASAHDASASGQISSGPPFEAPSLRNNVRCSPGVCIRILSPWRAHASHDATRCILSERDHALDRLNRSMTSTDPVLVWRFAGCEQPWRISSNEHGRAYERPLARCLRPHSDQ